MQSSSITRHVFQRQFCDTFLPNCLSHVISAKRSCVAAAMASGTQCFPTLPQQQQRWFAWDPRWKRKGPRPEKLARMREREKKEAPLKKRIQEVVKRRRAMKKLMTMDPQPANAEEEGINMSTFRTFQPTSSPFVYKSSNLSSNADEAPDPAGFSYWDRPNKFVRSRCAFVHVSKTEFGEQGWPETDVGEVAFLGRSNVGKSSLMNALMQAKLARTSKLPGRTQHAYYFGMFDNGMNVNDWRQASGFMVDLPGYGFAVGPDDAVSSWQGHTQRYLLARMRSGHLRRLYLLVDSRRAQQSLDWSILKWLDTEAVDIPYSVVFTKVDALRAGPPSIIPHLNTLSMRYNQRFRPQQNPVDHNNPEMAEMGVIPSVHNEHDYLNRAGGQSPIFHITSANKNLGLDELWKRVSLDFETYE